MFTTAGFFRRLMSGFSTERVPRQSGPCTPRRRLARQPRLESLEERRVPSGYRVINMGSLGGSAGVDLDINSKGEVVGAR